MELITECDIDLFAENLPTMEEIAQLSDWVHSSEASQISFNEQIEENISRTGRKATLATGIGLFILARYNEAAQKLEKTQDCKEKYIYLAYTLRASSQFDKAIENLQKSLDYEAEDIAVNLEKAATQRYAHNFDKAAKTLKKLTNYENVSAEYHYQLARLDEAQGLYEQAIENYQNALEISPNHKKALFHLAYCCDLAGDEEAAIDYYKQIASVSPVYVSALMNLAILYEDIGEFEKAGECVEKVLKFHPNHKKAILFEKDIESSKTMYYDEEQKKRKDRKSQTLETPLTDFELSVRSRNCLKKMHLETLGDLLKTTEAELLAYKNFGETSLMEIKEILDSKSLRLGLALENNQFSAEQTAQAISEEDQELLNKNVDELKLSVRSRKCIQRLNIRTIGELIQKTEAELLGRKNFGVTSLNEIKKALGNYGLELRTLD